MATAVSVLSLQTYAPLMPPKFDDIAWILQSVAESGELAMNAAGSWETQGGHTMWSWSYVHSMRLVPRAASVEQLSCAFWLPTTSTFCGLFVNRPTASKVVHKTCMMRRCKLQYTRICTVLYRKHKELRYDRCYQKDNTGFTSHTCIYSPSAEHHLPLAGTHWAYPQGMAWLSGPGWLITCGYKIFPTGSWTRRGHPSHHKPGPV